MRLRKLQDTFAANPPDEYKEQIIFRQASDPWYATVVLRGSVTGGQRLEGAALGQSAQDAREAALRTLLDQLPRRSLGAAFHLPRLLPGHRRLKPKERCPAL
eukprot:g530.t1